MGHGQIEGHPLGGSFIYGTSHWEIDVFFFNPYGNSYEIPIKFGNPYEIPIKFGNPYGNTYKIWESLWKKIGWFPKSQIFCYVRGGLGVFASGHGFFQVSAGAWQHHAAADGQGSHGVAVIYGFCLKMLGKYSQ